MSGKGKSKKEVTRNSMVKRLEQSTWHIVLIGKQDGTSEILTGFDNPQDTASILMHWASIILDREEEFQKELKDEFQRRIDEEKAKRKEGKGKEAAE